MSYILKKAFTQHFIKIAVIAVLIFSSSLSFAQNGGIKGVVIDDQSKQPVEYASVALLKGTDSSLVSGTVSKANGYFEFDKITSRHLQTQDSLYWLSQ